MNDLNKTLQTRASAYRYLWDNEDWDTFMLVFTGTDRLMHFLWNAYEDHSHPCHSGFLDHFSHIDSIIGEIVEKLHNDDLLIILSDHGFEMIKKDINVNAILKQEGFLKFASDLPSSLEEIVAGTKAFALDPGRIYLNRKGEFPLGDVSPEDQFLLLNELADMFTSIEYNGNKVIKHCFRKEAIYHGPLLPYAPDLVLVGNDGFNLRGGIVANNVIADSTLAGKHTQSDAFLMVYDHSARILVPDTPKVTDIVSIMSRFEERLS
jgi:predicted AlkP superfamily phosphohydrolase/phosphomutase